MIAAAHLGEGILGKLRGDQPPGVVEAQETILMARLPLLVAGAPVRTDQIDQLADSALLGLAQDGRIGLRRGQFDGDAHLVKTERAHPEPLRQMGHVPQLLGHLAPRPARPLGHPEALGHPRRRRRGTLGSPGLPPVELAENGQQRPEGLRDNPTQPFRFVHQVIRGCLFDNELHSRGTVASRANVTSPSSSYAPPPPTAAPPPPTAAPPTPSPPSSPEKSIALCISASFSNRRRVSSSNGV